MIASRHGKSVSGRWLGTAGKHGPEIDQWDDRFIGPAASSDAEFVRRTGSPTRRVAFALTKSLGPRHRLVAELWEVA